MSRPARQFSSTGLYHIVFRGMSRQNIFEEDNDFVKFKEILEKVKIEMAFEIYAYCLMDNHVHLFIKEKELGNITKIMLKLLSNYVGWYNRKYLRSGSLIGNRYKSEAIEDEKNFFAVTRYIHQNPTKAGVVDNISDYKWSSYHDYLNDEDSITDIYFVLGILSEKNNEAKKLFMQLHNQNEPEKFTLSDSKRLTDEQVKRKINNVLKDEDVRSIGLKPKNERNEILRYLREKEGLTIGQLERVTGISRGIISRSYINVQKQARPQ